MTLARLAPILFAVLQIVTPLLPQFGLGVPIGDQSDRARTLVTPAGWAFAIWGPLYAGSIVFAVYQALPARRDDPLLARLRWPAAGAFLGDAVWVAYTQVEGLSAVSSAIILLTLACLFVIYRRFAQWPQRFRPAERWCAVVPLSALAGWLTAAAIANIAASLRFHGIALPPAPAAAMVVAGGAVAAGAVVAGRGNLAYALVFLWALAAIHAAGGRIAGAVAAAAIAAALLVIGATVVGLRRAAVMRRPDAP